MSDLELPPERRKQFNLIEAARKTVLEWARSERIPLEHVEFVVPFVETDFSLNAVFFYRDRADVSARDGDGTSLRLAQRLRDSLRQLGYPAEWVELVTATFASEQEVDERYEGSYYYFLR